jgi:hypothetical protein
MSIDEGLGEAERIAALPCTVNRKADSRRAAERACVGELRRLLVASMKLRDGEMQRIATSVLTRLEKAGLVRIVSNRAAIEQRIVAALRANLRAEEDIEAEAARFAESHSRELVGMDRHKILQMVKERIAKEKGFTL